MRKFEDILAEDLKLPEEARVSIQEAWSARLAEAKEEVTAELREEFAQKFEHDKSVMIESVDKFLNDKVRSEMEEFATDKKALAEERVVYKARVAEHIKVLEKFLTATLAKEVKELREDRNKQAANVSKLEGFVLKQLAEEVKEFHSDKKTLAEQRVKIIREGKKELAETKAQFVKKAAKLIEKQINSTLANEIKSFRKDIREARENDFGRRIFESFVTEYMGSHLNEAGEIAKLQKQTKMLEAKLEEATVIVAKEKQLTESVERKLAATQDRVTRDKKLNELLSPLGKQQREVMSELLQTVKTGKLDEGFKKYLPAVLNEKKATQTVTERRPLKESVRTTKTGDRRANPAQQQEDDSLAVEIGELRKLAGINNK
jgi:hypothetical protein